MSFNSTADSSDDFLVRISKDERRYSRNVLLVAATVYAESIVRPLRQGTDATVDQFLDAAGVSIVPIDRAVARRAAALRAQHQSLRLPDAMSLATAIATDSALLTLDKKLRQIARSVPLPS